MHVDVFVKSRSQGRDKSRRGVDYPTTDTVADSNLQILMFLSTLRVHTGIISSVYFELLRTVAVSQARLVSRLTILGTIIGLGLGRLPLALLRLDFVTLNYVIMHTGRGLH